MFPRSLYSLTLALLCVIGIGSLHQTANAGLMIDFNDKDEENTQSGWEAFSSVTDTNNKTVNYSGYDDLAGAGNDVSVTTAGVEFSRDGGTPTHSLDDMLRDLVLRNDASSTITITIGSLLAGDYTVTTYHHVEEAGGGSARTSFDLAVQDGDSAAFGQAEGTHTMGSNDTPTIDMFTINSNGSDDVILRLTQNTSGGSGGQDWWGINGFEIEAIPAPAALPAGLVLLGFVAMRRRRA